MSNFTDKLHRPASQRGFSLIEVLIGIGIFAIGMLALASLQGALTRSTAEAKIRTTAVKIAEMALEEQQGFALISGGDFSLISGGASASFTNIVDVAVDSPIFIYFSDTDDDGKEELIRSLIQPAAGILFYTLTQDVTDYYYDLASNDFTTEDPTGTGTAIPDFKTVIVNVAWNDDRNYVIDEGTQTTGNLGGGSVNVSTTISKMSTVNAVQVAEQDDEDIIAPDIVYTPGENPDIVSLGLGENKFKESLTPEPKVYRSNLETRFDVVTYSQGNAGALFLRREEFVAVSCDCTLSAGNADNPGNTPVVWAGDEYTEPQLVTKPYGTPVGNVAQSPLCSTCCRDHHDAAGSPLYDPSRPTGEYADNGNHKHYSRSEGGFVEAAAGDDYVEACRLVRKDGFFRLTQDFRLEGLNTFPGDYLITDTQVEDYSDYVIGEVYVKDDTTTYVPAAIALGDGYQLSGTPPVIHSAPRTASDEAGDGGDLTLGYTNLPTSTGAAFQQLRSRSIYMDNLSSDLRGVIVCLEGKTDDEKLADPGLCDQGDVELDRTGSVNILELIPFFEVQTTYLNDWLKDYPTANDFSLTNETVKTSDANGPTHSRGKVTNRPANTNDWVRITANRDVTGITSTDLISNRLDNHLPTLSGDWPPGDIEVITGASNPTFDGTVITINLSSEVNGLKAANVGFSVTNTTCDYATTTGDFTCFIPTGTSSPSLTISGFDKPPKEVRLCSNHQFGSPAELPVTSYNVPGAPKTVDMSYSAAGTAYSLWLTEEQCPAEPEPCTGLICN